MKINWPKAADFVERVSATFVQAFIALALVTGLSDSTDLKVAGAAGTLASAKFVYAELNVYLKSDG